MKAILAEALLLLASLVPVVAKAGDLQNGNDIYAKMTSSEFSNNAFAFGYVAAIVDAGDGSAVHGVRFCLPYPLPLGQLHDIAKKWLSENPERRHYSASGLIAVSLQEAFPCKDTTQ